MDFNFASTRAIRDAHIMGKDKQFVENWTEFFSVKMHVHVVLVSIARFTWQLISTFQIEAPLIPFKSNVFCHLFDGNLGELGTLLQTYEKSMWQQFK
jgi:hypothetical protein